MNEDRVRQIIREETEKRLKESQYSVVRTPIHTHNNIDSPQLKFIGLSDTPNTFLGQSQKLVRVNSIETALEFTTSGAGSPGGANTDIQFNDSGSFGGSASFTWDDSLKEMSIGGYIYFSLDPGSVNQIAMVPGPANGPGGQLTLVAGDGGTGNANGGTVEIASGNGTGSGYGGYLFLDGGQGGATGGGGNVILTSGNGGAADGGIFRITSGSSGSGDHNGGNIEVVLGTGTGTGHTGRLNISGLPTSSAGLSSGDIWNSSGTLKIV